MEETIKGLEEIQLKLMAQRIDHNGNILERDDLLQIQQTIEIIKNLIIEPTYIWKKPKN